MQLSKTDQWFIATAKKIHEFVLISLFDSVQRCSEQVQFFSVVWNENKQNFSIF